MLREVREVPLRDLLSGTGYLVEDSGINITVPKDMVAEEDLAVEIADRLYRSSFELTGAGKVIDQLLLNAKDASAKAAELEQVKTDLLAAKASLEKDNKALGGKVTKLEESVAKLENNNKSLNLLYNTEKELSAQLKEGMENLVQQNAELEEANKGLSAEKDELLAAKLKAQEDCRNLALKLQSALRLVKEAGNQAGQNASSVASLLFPDAEPKLYELFQFGHIVQDGKVMKRLDNGEYVLAYDPSTIHIESAGVPIDETPVGELEIVGDASQVVEGEASGDKAGDLQTDQAE